MVMAARTAATGRLKKGRMLPSDLMSDVTKALLHHRAHDDTQHHRRDRVTVALHDVTDSTESGDGDDREQVVASCERADRAEEDDHGHHGSARRT